MVEKRFPATVTIDDDVTTFLHDKKINAELYAYLQSKSYPDEKKRTVVKKSDLDKQDEICKIIGVRSRSTLRTHLLSKFDSKTFKLRDFIVVITLFI